MIKHKNKHILYRQRIYQWQDWYYRSHRGLSCWQSPLQSATYAALTTPTSSPRFRTFVTLYIWICPTHLGQVGVRRNLNLFLFHKYFHILLIFWRTLYHDPGHIFYNCVRNGVHRQQHYSMDIVVLLWAFWAWYTFPALFLIHGSLLGAYL